MAAHSTSSTSRSFRSLLSGRRAAVALAVGAGVVLTPLPALASATATPTAAAPTAIVASTHASQVVVNTAMAELGKPYVWAGAGPSSFDCSGLTQFAYKAAGISLPHSSHIQSTMGTPVARNALRPGDLVFFYAGASHVGIYIGNDEVVHAPTPGDVVKVTKIQYMPFYSARRLG
jgi:cell wall-associated NlpC family hydrolase